MEIFVNESLFDNIKHNIEEMELDEANYPASFDIEKFSSISSYNGRLRYAKERLPKLGQGSSRAVFKIDDETVLKIAMNEKGLAQNETEASYYYNLRDMSCFAKVYEYSAEDYWIEMELAVKAKKSDFKKIIGVSFEDYWYYISHNISVDLNDKRFKDPKNIAHISQDDLKKLSENEFVSDVIWFCVNWDVAFMDLGVIGAYGVIGGHRLVLVDYGLSNDNAREYYGRK